MLISKDRLHEIIFEADTPAGKAFDIVLITSIIMSVIAVLLDSVQTVHARYGTYLHAAEWLFTVLFTIEYIFRLYCVKKPLRYALSFYGFVDILAIVPTYIGLFIPGGHYLLAIRVLRVLRVFRVLKLSEYLGEAAVLLKALRASRYKIIVFLFTVLTLVVVLGSIIYLVEGRENGFTSIPASIYWAIVTLTTVGYGDISPQTPLGQTIAAVIMILGYSIIAVPTGVVSAEMTRAMQQPVSTQVCPYCSKEGHDADAEYCKQCGSKL